MGAIRELLGAGTLFGQTITTDIISPSIIMLLPPGGFFVFGILIAVANKLDKRPVSERPSGCNACLSRGMCKRFKEEGGIE
jgi:electron transport complex protein RnfE